jgi:hypothetical protein
VALGVLEAVDRATAPGGHRHVGLLGQQLGLDLVAQASHRVGRGSDEHEPEPFDQLRELRVLGDEAPADPDGVGAARLQCPLQLGVVEVGAGGLHVVAQADRLVGGSDEQGSLLRLRVQGDDLDVVARLLVQLPNRSDQPDRRLPPVDHCKSSEHVRLHRRTVVPSSPAVLHNLGTETQ